MTGLYGPTREEHVALSLQHRHLWQDFREEHPSRTIDHDTQRAFRSVLAQQHNRLAKIGIPQRGSRDKKDSFAE